MGSGRGSSRRREATCVVRPTAIPAGARQTRTAAAGLVRGPVLVLLSLLLGGCAGSMHTRAQGTPSTEPVDCRGLFDEVAERVAAAGVRDAQTRRLPGFPHLRVDRFWASYADEVEGEALRYWLRRLQQMGVEGTLVELSRLDRGALPPERTRDELAAEVRHCAARLVERDLGRPGALERLREAAPVEDDYSTLARVLGLYPVTSIFMRRGAVRLQERVRRLYGEFAGGGAEGMVAYGPAFDTRAAVPTASLLRRAAERNPLGVPWTEPEESRALLEAFAPVWRIEQRSAADRPGRVLRGGDGPTVDDGVPAVYAYVSHTRFQGAPLLQLNYVIWFSERPSTGWIDWYGGRLDGVVWRVTLDDDGAPLVYDSIHSCGCYHQVFPTGRLALAAQDEPASEPLFIPQAAPALQPGGRIELTLRAGDHYLVRVAALPEGIGGQRGYRLLDYDALRRLRGDDGSVGLFRADGIVAGTERLERWFLWPAGIREPGAMRQRGRQPIAFVGRRHFDDANLLDGFFQRAGVPD